MTWLCLLLLALLAVLGADGIRCLPDCWCGRGPSRQQEISCKRFNIFAEPSSFVQVQCFPEMQLEDYALLQDIDIRNVESVKFRYCPLPNSSLFAVLETMGLSAATTLLFSFTNISDTLQQRHLSGPSNITQLKLLANGITDLPDDLLRDLPNITVLDLQSNDLTRVPEVVTSLRNLRSLELGANNITNIEPGIFRNLTRLKMLNLWQNHLRNLTDSTFDGLTNLESLELSGNNLKQLPRNILGPLSKLSQASLFANSFTSLPDKLFASTPLLTEVRLNDNRVDLSTVPAGLLSNLPSLRSVQLQRSNITALPSDLLTGSKSVTHVLLQGNRLTTLPKDIFADTVNLVELDLSHNQLTELPDRIFVQLSKLSKLKLNHNHLTHISEFQLQGLTNLTDLYLDHNALKRIHPVAFGDTTSLRTLYLSNNQLTFEEDSRPDYFGYISPLENCLLLEYLYLANNSIRYLYSDWYILLSNIKLIDLSYNKFTNLTAEDLQFSSSVILDMRHNLISVVDLKAALSLSLAASQQHNADSISNVRVLLDDNPFTCDCQAGQLVDYLQEEVDPAVRSWLDLQLANATCATPEHQRGVALAQLRAGDLWCNLDMFAGNHVCPEPCTCEVYDHLSVLLVNCSHRNLKRPPSALPVIVDLNRTQLHLANNALQSFSTQNWPGYDRITTLSLSHNSLYNFTASQLPRRIEVLELDNNNLTRLDPDLVQVLSLNSSTLKYISLYGNPWKCDCDTRDFLKFLQDNFKKVMKLSLLTCEPGDKRSLALLTTYDLCPGFATTMIVASITLAVFGVLLGTLAALYYRYQQEIKVWLYARNLFLWLITEEELDKDKEYDAFVSYSHKDEDFVVNHLLPGLEKEPNHFKLCLHYRDWVAGEWISNQIARSVENSRRTLIVLSQNFLESVWGRMEFCAAHKQALSEGRARVIVLLYGDIGPLDNLDPDLKTYLSTNTYVKWGDPWFWDKLRYALPHKPSLEKRKCVDVTKNIGVNDKMELMVPTTPSATTPPAEIVIDPMKLTNGYIKPLDIARSNGHAQIFSELNGSVKCV